MSIKSLLVSLFLNICNLSILKRVCFISETHQEDVSLLNFFLDRDIIPMEFTIDSDLNEMQIKDIFESIIARVGKISLMSFYVTIIDWFII